MKIFTFFIIAGISLHLSIARAVDKLPDITYYTENYPPSNYLVAEELVGLSVETLKVLWQQMQLPEQNIFLVPWARGYRNTLANQNTVLFTMARTVEREQLFKWVGPIYTAEHLLVTKAGFKEKIINIAQVHHRTVAAIRNDISELTLLQEGFPDKNIVRITHLKQALLMLMNERIEMIVVSRSSLKSLLKDNNLSYNDVSIIYSVNKIDNYFAFNKNTSDSTIASFQKAFDETKRQRLAILDKYGF
ncbi:MAG: substrate-binding periplasmic protein [Thalassotalea sp.]